jgi:hypothetical protein
MDARSLADAAQVQVGTLNSWVQRGLVSGMTTGARGRLRDFDLDTSINVALIVELVRIGLSAPTASEIAKNRGQSKRLLLMFDLPLADGHPEAASLRDHWRRAPAPIGFDSEEQLPTIFQRYGGGVPGAYTVINLERIAERMQQAHDEWERRGQGAAT